MKTLACLALCLALTSCATKGTVLYSPRTGGKLAEFHVDMDRMTYTGGGVACTIEQHRTSRTVAARGKAWKDIGNVAGDQARKAFGGF